jgi:hypothetical protein
MLFPRRQSPAQQNAHATALLRIRDRESRGDIADVPPGLALVVYILLMAVVFGLTAWAVSQT